MKTPLIIALFCFFCLISCQEVGPYRDLEITIINADHAVIKLYQLPSNQLIRQTDFDREYQETVYLNNVPDGEYKLEVAANEFKIDTVFQYNRVVFMEFEV